MRHQSVVRRGTGDWRITSQFHYLSDEEILQSIQGASHLQRGCRFDSKTRFAAIQIPAGSRYYDNEGLSTLKDALGDIAPYIKLFQYPECRYLYIFFSESLPSVDVGAALSECLMNAGVEVAVSTMYVHPTTNAMPLPLQPDFAWLNADGQIIVRRDEISLESAVSLFLFDFTKNAISGAFFFGALSKVTANVEPTSSPKALTDLKEQLEEPSTPVSSATLSLPGHSDDTITQLAAPAAPSETLAAVDKHKNYFDYKDCVQLTIPMLLAQLPTQVAAHNAVKESRAPPRNIRNRVTRKARSQNTRKSSSGRS